MRADNGCGGDNETHTQRGDRNNRRWERSFPDGSVSGLKWVLDVLDDLIGYADDRGEELLKAELAQARSRASEVIAQRRTGSKRGTAKS